MKSLLRYIGRICFRMGDYCMTRGATEKEQAVKRWIQAKGDETMRLMYPEISENSFVMDLGGYKGQWAGNIYSMYNCTVWVFEPVKEFADNIQERFSKNKKIRIFHFGLGKSSEKQKIYVAEDSSSSYQQNTKRDHTAEISLKDIHDFFFDNDIRQVDLMKINIEGGEYDVLERLIDSGLIKSIKNIQVQFHDFVPDARNRMKRIQENLKLTHFPTYQYEFVWENWQSK